MAMPGRCTEMLELLVMLAVLAAPWLLMAALALWAFVAWGERQDIRDIDRINRRHGG